VSAPILVLASASPRRAAILAALGIPFRTVTPSVDETLLPGETGAAAAERLARSKAQSVAPQDLPVLAADTLVVCGGAVLGKPATADEAARMLRTLSGRSHEVVTGMCLATGRASRSAVETTVVTFAPMDETEIAWYVATGEPLDKAGAYHVDDRGALFIAAVSGSPSNVAGLPVRLMLRLAREAGVRLGPEGR
jgi:nucleoside triphosphate pyrophosphatase